MTDDGFFSARVRPAAESDCRAISELLSPYMDTILLPKTVEQVRADISSTVVGVIGDRIVGAVNYVDYGDCLYEVRGLAVHPDFQRHGIGKKLISGITDLVKAVTPCGSLDLFALTYRPDFFYSLGWSLTEMEKFPKKVFNDCSICKKKDDCHEIAVEIRIKLK